MHAWAGLVRLGTSSLLARGDRLPDSPDRFRYGPAERQVGINVAEAPRVMTPDERAHVASGSVRRSASPVVLRRRDISVTVRPGPCPQPASAGTSSAPHTHR
jgi:hypothetical protein